MSLDPDVVNDIAAELGISPAFVEKDWPDGIDANNDDVTRMFGSGDQA